MFQNLNNLPHPQKLALSLEQSLSLLAITGTLPWRKYLQPPGTDLTLPPWSIRSYHTRELFMHQECKEFSTHHGFARTVLSIKDALANPFATSQHSLLLWDVGSEAHLTSQIELLPLPSHRKPFAFCASVKHLFNSFSYSRWLFSCLSLTKW